MALIDFYNKYFLINLNEYPNIGIDLEINKILFCFLVGMVVTTIIFNYRTEGNSRLIKKLLRYESTCEENAKTLGELGLDNFNSRLTLSGNSRINKIISRVGAKKMTYEEYTAAVKSKEYKEEKINFETAKFYINEDGLESAKRISETNNTSLINTVLMCVLMVTIYVFIMFLMPSILTLINNILG